MVMNGSAQLFRRRGGFANGRERANACKCMSRFRCPMRKEAMQNKVRLMKNGAAGAEGPGGEWWVAISSILPGAQPKSLKG